MLGGNRKNDSFFSFNLLNMETIDAAGVVYSSSLSGLFVGPVEVGKVETRYSRDGTKEKGDMGSLELRPFEGKQFSTYQLTFKEGDYEITSVGDWIEEESKYFGKSRKRDVKAKMTITEATVYDKPIGEEGEVLPFDGKLEITLLVPQSEKIESSP